MFYHVINLETYELKTLLAEDALDMEYDAQGRVVNMGKDLQSYFLIANKDLVVSSIE